MLIVAGAINIDFTAHTTRAPVPGETVADGVLFRQPGGKGANQAIAAARLGATVRLIGAVGDDAVGQEMIENLAAAGVDTHDLQLVAHPTGTALIVVDAAGENSIVVCPGANRHIDIAQFRIDPNTAVLAQLEISPKVVEAIVTATRGFVAINVSPSTELSPVLLRRADLFIVNETEFAALPQLSQAPLTAVTLGARGAVLISGGRQVAEAVVPASRVVNTVGAGDAFAAALTVGLLRGDGPHVALRRACAVGAEAVADSHSQPALRLLAHYSGS